MRNDNVFATGSILLSRLWLFLTTRQFRLRHPDLWLIAALLLLNPIVWGWRLRTGLTPDSIAYLSLADFGIPAGNLFLAPWDHVDSGTILPPLYPALIALTNSIRPDSIANALLLNKVFMLLMSVMLFFFLRRLSNRWIAAGTVLLVQLNWHSLFFGTSVLTEPLFLLLVIASIYLLHLCTNNERSRLTLFFMTGVVAGLAFLSRQVGLLLIVFIILWLASNLFRDFSSRMSHARKIMTVMIGWAVIVGPYALALYYQTGASPFQQSYRMQKYVVRSNNPSLLQEIARYNSGKTTDYVDIYHKRRLLPTHPKCLHSSSIDRGK